MVKGIIKRMAGNLADYPGPWLTCFIILLVLPFFAGFIPFVRFTEEEIVVTVHPRSIAVDATYCYNNSFPFLSIGIEN
jgi:hypothetical protein